VSSDRLIINIILSVLTYATLIVGAAFK